MSKTKIIATIGPASESEVMIEKMITAGVSVFRFNFSHGALDEHVQRAERVRKTALRLSKHVAILADLQGPKIRIACFENEKVRLKKGQAFILDANLDKTKGDNERVGLDYPELIEDINEGQILLLDDGRIQLKTLEVNHAEKHIVTEVLTSGTLSNKKGLNVLGGGLSAPALTEKDKKDIKVAAHIKAEFVAVSFPRSAQDIHEARQLIREAGSNADIISKIERAEVVESLETIDEMILASDAIMVARGDLGVEIGDAQLPKMQKKLIERANYFGKPSITATQILESMISSSMPTRAEVSDVANAVLDGTDALMLSAESATGQFPVEAVQAMVRVAEATECQQNNAEDLWSSVRHYCSEPAKAMAVMSVFSAAQVKESIGIVIVSPSGDSAKLMSRCQGHTSQQWALSDNCEALRKMSLLRGVIPMYICLKGQAEGELLERVESHFKPILKQQNITQFLLANLEPIEGIGSNASCRLVEFSPH
ncbi:pyruvate kinase [Vibrio hannami]|uniref:pyruvate kinase n=1 Tax=Vibrio hannami TaxID=2717094 RepID=UPI00240FE5F3|nr:pyruvate kinase [Vibrio hannami]MDG3086838.1 pyruvate kinase [Vibrio hannami]